jgi:ubiquitin C-terminal hydrolase
MSELTPYDPKYVPNLFALKNNGNYCYMNSLIQALMSCSSFNQYCDQYRKFANEDSNDKVKLAEEYLRLLTENPPTSKYGKIETNDVTNLLTKLTSIRKYSKYNLIIGQQEDIHEGLVLLLEALEYKDLGPDILFHTRYSSEIVCKKCRKAKKVGKLENWQEPSEIVINLSEEDCHEQIDNKEAIERYIKMNIQIPRDYRCENCNVVNEYDKKTKEIEANIIHTYRLNRLSEIIILLFKKYHDKKSIFFPQCLDFTSMQGNLHYDLVAQVEHWGTQHHGHYTAKCLRPTPTGLYDSRRDRANKIIAELSEKLALIADSETEKAIQAKRNIEAKIIKLRRTIAADQEDMKNGKAIFNFNDNRVTYFGNDGFIPSKETYMVFYHLVRISPKE